MMRINDAWVKSVALDHVDISSLVSEAATFLKLSSCKHLQLSISQGVDDATMH